MGGSGRLSSVRLGGGCFGDADFFTRGRFGRGRRGRHVLDRGSTTVVG